MEIQPTKPHKYTIIFLHGRDSTAEEFAPELFESQVSDGRTLPELLLSTKWVFPTAGMIISERFGVEMSQWFDMYTTEDPHERQNQQQLQQLDKAARRIVEIVEREAALVGGPQDIFLGGISQGCAVAVTALLLQQHRLGGFIGLSSWLPTETVATVPRVAAHNTAVFLSHSSDDDVIDVKYGEKLQQALHEAGMNVEWHKYEDGGHWVNEPQGIDDIVAFLKIYMRIVNGH